MNTTNFCIVQLPRCDLAFSYETLIGIYQRTGANYASSYSGIGFATEQYGDKWVLCQNNWGPTTGKHLNRLDNNKTARVPHVELLKIAEEALGGFGYADLVAAVEDTAKSLANL